MVIWLRWNETPVRLAVQGQPELAEGQVMTHESPCARLLGPPKNSSHAASPALIA